MARVPPIVHAQLIQGVAYLLEWQRLPVTEGRGWGARIAWLEQTDDGAWFVKGGIVPDKTVRPIEGQDYSRVPRDPRPSDPSDPRDPKSRKRGRDRTYMTELAQAQDPDGNWDEWMRRAEGPF
ncbi:hypothetical protein ACGFNU_03395 [Spirillospora sp. NPDC048911]|uniref:hypothetical protein n=1 Tax=Spirillospora sp. NPDC048911 TaxID=3364527 RepID=UPI0037175373